MSKTKKGDGRRETEKWEKENQEKRNSTERQMIQQLCRVGEKGETQVVGKRKREERGKQRGTERDYIRISE
jgi:hypothetical protein